MDLVISPSDNYFSAVYDLQSNRQSLAYTALSRGVQDIQAQQYETALADFKRAAAYNPDMVDAYRWMGRANELLGRPDGAIQAFQKALQKDPTNTDARSDLADCYITNQRYADAEKQLKLLIQADGTAVSRVVSLGYVYLSQGRFTEAQTQFQKAATQAPNDPTSYFNLGTVLNKQGEYTQAVDQFKKAIAMKPDYAQAYSGLAYSYLGLNQKDSAREQVNALNSIGTDESISLASQLDNDMYTPGIIFEDGTRSTFNTRLGPGTTLDALDPSLATPGAAETFTVVFQFNQAMDITSMQSIFNWSISQSQGGPGGAYNNGSHLNQDRQISVMPFPMAVRYDPLTYRAVLSFRIRQNDAGDGLIDPSHLAFRFSGYSADGRAMDPSQDEYDGSAGFPY